MRKYENVPIGKLKPYERNARIHISEQIEKIAKSIKEFGFLNPILIDKDFGIIAGHGRVLAAKEIGMKEVPCLFIEDLSEAQKRAYVIADNKLALDASWDEEILKIELQELENLNFDITLTGFSLEDLDFDVSEEVETEEDDFDIDENLSKIPKSKYGEIYQLGNHRLMCGDSTKKEDVLKLAGSELIDLFVTDPPYNVDYMGKTEEKLKIQNDKMSDEDFELFLHSSFLNANEIMKPGAAFYIWFASKKTLNFYNSCLKAGFEIRQQLIWLKNSITFGRQDYQWKYEPCIYGWKDGSAHYFIDGRTQTTVLEYDKPLISELHPHDKTCEINCKINRE